MSVTRCNNRVPSCGRAGQIANQSVIAGEDEGVSFGSTFFEQNAAPAARQNEGGNSRQIARAGNPRGRFFPDCLQFQKVPADGRGESTKYQTSAFRAARAIANGSGNRLAETHR
jgi:hypothetical protein